MGNGNDFNKGKKVNSAETQKFMEEKKTISKSVLGALNLSDEDISALASMPVSQLQKLCLDLLNNKFSKTHNILENNKKGKEKGVEKIFRRIDITPKNGEKKSVPEIIFNINDDNTVNINISPYNNFGKVSYSGEKMSFNQAFSEAYMFCAKGETYLKQANLKATNIDPEEVDVSDYI